MEQDISSLYGDDGGFQNDTISRNSSSLWHKIIKAGKEIDKAGIPFSSSFTRVIGNGMTTSFRFDIWLPNSTKNLCSTFPRLFALETNKSCLVAERVGNSNHGLEGYWEWTNSIRGRALSDLNNLSDSIAAGPMLSDKDDSWSWSLKSNGSFTLATRKNLVVRGIDIDPICPFCEELDEDSAHLFVKCRYTIPLWRNFFSWWHAAINIPNDIPNAINATTYNIGPENINKVMWATSRILLWLIWRWRNKLVHGPIDQRQAVKDEDIMVSLRVISHLWLSNRKKMIHGEFNSWKTNPKSLVM
ncbi:uncharacterized protein [Rutidosis leptorrhynchoides]|uniref:uncharacterized protein n=1 Tax=Rutidosis leptorrhynchoides TaxID=125765 RepID=UPI003A98D1C1